MEIVLKRVYEDASPEDAYRVLVDQIWPRGISKEKAALDEWDKDLAPSTELREWFHHDPLLWDEFSRKYKEELLERNPGKPFLEKNGQQEKITLVYAARDEKHCHPLVLRDYLEQLLNNKSKK